MPKDAKLDIIVFGASGFTGKFVVKELVALQASRSTSPTFTFGIAGRSASKLQGMSCIISSPSLLSNERSIDTDIFYL